MAKLKASGSSRARRVKRGKLPYTMTAVPGGFEACIVVRSKSTRSTKMPQYHCGEGRNPRLALGSALRTAATAIARRPGAFAGLGK